jgi:hypothetical protein
VLKVQSPVYITACANRRVAYVSRGLSEGCAIPLRVAMCEKLLAYWRGLLELASVLKKPSFTATSGSKDAPECD